MGYQRKVLAPVKGLDAVAELIDWHYGVRTIVSEVLDAKYTPKSKGVKPLLTRGLVE